MSTSVEISLEVKHLIKSAASRLKGVQKRMFMAEVSKAICFNNCRQTETEFGWNRKTVEQGIHELRTGLECYGHYEVCGKRRFEDDNPQLEKDIRSLVEPESQADPKLKNTFAYTRITAHAVRQKLMDEKGWQEDQLPKDRTMNDILNRLGYKLHRVQKTKPQKKSRKPMPSSTMCDKSMKQPAQTIERYESA